MALRSAKNDGLDVPAQAFKSSGNVVAVRQVSMPLDRDVIVIVDPTQVGQLQVTRQRRGFVAHAFHQIAIAGKRVGIETKQLESGAIEMCGSPACRNRHTNAVSHTLP